MRSITVEIMGQNLVVASEDDDAWVRSVANTVDQRMRAIRDKSRLVSSNSVAILAALNFADELARLQREHRELIAQIDALSKRLTDRIGEV